MPGGEKNGQSGGWDFFSFFPNFIFYKLEYTEGKRNKKKIGGKDGEKRFYPQVLDPVSQWTGNAFLFEDGLIDTVNRHTHRDQPHLPFSSHSRVPTAQGKQGKSPKYSLSGKTQGIWKFCQNTENLVCSSCSFPDSRDA